jgi:RsiW-degrading membrane proteinase PrsW (M82 family)
MVLLLLALAPAVAIIWFIYTKDTYEKEPSELLLKSFFLGILSIIPAIIGGNIGEAFGIGLSVNTFTTFIYAFVVVALSEELAKFIFLRWVMFPKKAFNEPFDGIVYAVMIGMGFAAFENVMYAMQGGVVVAVLRMFTAVPAHAAFGIIMGYYVGLAKFDYLHPENRTTLLLKGLVGATLVHGAYDFFLMQEQYEGLGVMAFVTLFLAIKFGKKAIKLHQDQSPFKDINQNITQEEQLFVVYDKNEASNEENTPDTVTNKIEAVQKEDEVIIPNETDFGNLPEPPNTNNNDSIVPLPKDPENT